jgi:hypothetical protein
VTSPDDEAALREGFQELALVDHRRTRLLAGSSRVASTYRRYGFRCTKRDARGNYHLA